MNDFTSDPRFKKIRPLAEKALLASPFMHGDELGYVKEAFDSGWVTTVGKNIEELEKDVAARVGVKYAVGLSSGTAALHMAIKLAAERIYGSSTGVSTPSGLGKGGALRGVRVFCSDLTFAATVNPIVYEGGEPVFIDTEYETWNMSPEALEQAFRIYPDVRIVVLAHLYGTPGKLDELRSVCRQYGAYMIEDAAESFGATYKGIQTGCFGECAVISFNGNKIITGSAGGMFLTNHECDANRVRKWSTQSREAAPWYQHEEIGYNYRMSNVIAGVARGQIGYLEEHIGKKREIYKRYEEGLKDLPIKMNPFDDFSSTPNFWLSCMIIDPDAMCRNQRSGYDAIYGVEDGKSCPTEILEALTAFGAEGRPIWKPMHMQPIYMNHAFVTVEGSGRGRSNAYIGSEKILPAGEDIFNRGLCLPSDIKMNGSTQDIVLDLIHCCFK